MPQNNLNRPPSEDELKDELRRTITRSKDVVDFLSSDGKWQTVLEDLIKTKKRIDDNWQYMDDEKKLQELRVSKMAIIKIINFIADYQNDVDTALTELYPLEHPKDTIAKDVDTE